MTDLSSNDQSPEARFLSLNLRLSTVENTQESLSLRLDEVEEELQEVWEAIEELRKG